jgi:hypothetical protein
MNPALRSRNGVRGNAKPVASATGGLRLTSQRNSSLGPPGEFIASPFRSGFCQRLSRSVKLKLR